MAKKNKKNKKKDKGTPAYTSYGDYKPYYQSDNEWGNWYGGDWGNYRTPGKSASSFWASSSWSSSSDENWKFKNILYNIANAANVPANSIGKGERQLRVKWADNKKDAEEHDEAVDNANSLTKDTIILSTDVVGKESRRPTWSEGEQQDVLIADALTLATMKSTGSQFSEAQINAVKRGGNSPGSFHKEIAKMADHLWTAQENIVAEKAVLEHYPGFKSYYATYRDYWTDEDAREKLEQSIREANEQGVNWLDGAVAATRYEMLYPDQKLELPDVYREAVEAAKSAMPLDAPRDERGHNAIRASEEILRILPQERETKKNEDSQSGEEGSKQQKDDKGNSKMDPAPKFGEGRDSLGQQEKNTNLKPERDAESKRVAKSDIEGVKLSDTIERMILDEDTWRGGTDHVNVKVTAGCKDLYRQLVSNLKITINSMKNRLKLRQEKPNLMLHGLRRGGIDEGSLYKLAFHEPEPLIFEQPEIINRIDMAFAILIDESGSMNGQANGSKDQTRVEVARDVAIVLSESLRGNEGLELAVLGHTAQYRRQDGKSTGVAIHHYMTPDNPHVETLARSNSFGNNLDGYAMLETVRKMLKWYPYLDHRTIFVVSDGQPAGDGYGSTSAHQHMFRVCTAARRAGVNIYGIGIDNAYSTTIGEDMYGRGNFVVLANAVDSMALLCNFVVNAVRKTCVLSVQ